MTRVVFLHGFRSGILPDQILIALTPESFQGCLNDGLKPTVPDDHLDWNEILKDEENYLRWQIDWLRRLEKATGLSAARVATHFIKPPIDALVVATLVLKSILERLGPKAVAFVGPGSDAIDSLRRTDLQFRPRLGDTPLAFRILPIIAEQLGVDYESINVAGVTEEPRATSPLQSVLTAARRRAHIVLNVAWPPWASSKGPGTCILWYEGYGARTLVRSKRLEGRSILFLERGTPWTRLLSPVPWGFRQASNPIHIEIETSSPPMGREVLALLEEIDQWSGVPGVSSIMTSRLQAYVEQICPTIEKGSVMLADSLADQKLTELLATNPSSIEEFVALLAAERKSVRRVLFQHGDQAFSFDFWLITETQNFDEMRCSDPTVPAYLRRVASRHGLDAPHFVIESPRTAELQREADRWEEGAFHYRDLPIVYVPNVYTGDQYIVGTSFIQDAWYYRWQLRLLELMANNSALEFVWKALPSGHEAKDPIGSVIQENGIRNVRYEGRPLRTVVKQAGRLLLDYPSTALYEAIHYRKPVMCVFFRGRGRLREDIAHLFGRSLRECEDEASALAAIDEFVSGDPRAYLVPRAKLGELPLSKGPHDPR